MDDINFYAFDLFDTLISINYCAVNWLRNKEEWRFVYLNDIFTPIKAEVRK